MPLLSMQDISISFYGAYANKDVCLDVEAGEIHALLGENGAGKTTLMNILFGIYKPESGRIFWDGRETAFSSPQAAIDAGVGMVHQHFSLVDAMTVLDNILLGYRGDGLFLPRKKLRARVTELAEHYGLQIDPDATVGELSVGEKQRVEILKALFREIRLLILDEPTAVLTPGESEQLFGVLRQLKARGFAVILITHRLSEIMRNSDRVTILRAGRCEGTYETAGVTPGELSRLMLGRELETVVNDLSAPAGAPMLEMQGVTVYRSGRRRPALEDVTLTVASGEILGVAGVEGNGQKELAEAVAGIRRRRVRGRILLDGANATGTSVKARARRGLAYIPDDRLHDALVPDMDVRENLLLRAYDGAPFSRCHVFRKAAVDGNARAAMETYGVRATGTLGAHAPVRMLSGGNQQKIILAREIVASSRLIVASQPTRGLDVSASAFVRKKLLEQKRQGKGVLLISAELEEILALSDRVAVLYNGKIAGVLPRKEVTVEKLGRLMSGLSLENEEGAEA